MKTLLDFVPPPDICRTVECGNSAQSENGFCNDCVPVPKKRPLLRALLLPIALLASVLEI